MPYQFQPSQHIHIPQEKVRPAIRAAYELSVPVGLGFLHARPGPLDEETVERIATNPGGPSMDYVHGRQCKFHLTLHEGEYYVLPKWYDHTHAQLVELLTRIGVPQPEARITEALTARQQQTA